jgi:hypothetical protein
MKALMALFALVLLAACSGSPSSVNAGSPASSGSAVAFAACMRSHGVPDYPDPGSGGNLTAKGPQQLGVSSSVFQAAEASCQHLLPADSASFQQQVSQCMSGGDCPQALVQRLLASMREFSQCMRSHAVPNWPDPAIDSEGRPVFPVEAVPGTNRDYWHRPQITAKINECESLTGNPPVPFG